MQTKKWIIEPFLDRVQFEEMKQSFPVVKTAGVRAMNDLCCTDDEYKTFINEHPAWMKFHKMIFSKSFWENYLPTINVYSFSPNYMEHRSGAMDPRERRPFLYSRIDIGVATAGYGIENGGRGIHIDNKQRVISGLLYFTNQWTLDGGEFCFCTPDGRVTEKVPVGENKAILSHQDADAWHFVNPLKKGIRKFVYFSLNATWAFYKR